jgi:thiamine pyrophosphate-dependent acetolactate synthase large subunit-like protein
MEERCTGGDIIVRILKTAGVECIFGIISIHNIPIYDAILVFTMSFASI